MRKVFTIEPECESLLKITVRAINRSVKQQYKVTESDVLNCLVFKLTEVQKVPDDKLANYYSQFVSFSIWRKEKKNK